MAGALGGIHDGLRLIVPATDGTENQRILCEIFSGEIWQNEIVELVGGGEGTTVKLSV